MSRHDYERGQQNGCIPTDIEYGSRAYWDAAQGVWDAKEDREQEYRASLRASSTRSTGVGAGSEAALFPLLAIGFACYFAWEAASNWARLAYPYKAVAFFYYWAVIYPLKGYVWVWSYLTSPGLTQNSSLNIALGVGGIFGYTVSPLIGIGVIGGILQAIGLQRWWKTLLFGPPVFCLMWFLGSEAYTWILSLK